MKKKLIILSGAGTPAVLAANIYQDFLEQEYDITVIEESIFSFSKLWSFIRRRYAKQGFFSVISSLILRISTMLTTRSGPPPKRYTVGLSVEDINSPETIALVRSLKPSMVICNACSILKPPLLAAIECPIINLHCGVNPRYRGAGNFWAFYENNPEYAGVTVHAVDAGIDTGRRIAVRLIDFRRLAVPFAEIDSAAFQIGAEFITELLLQGIRVDKEQEELIPTTVQHLASVYYPFPGIIEYIKAKKNYERYVHKTISVENNWLESFSTLAGQSDKPVMKRLHWHDEATVAKRDSQVSKLYHERCGENCKILDVGCGDARYSDMLRSGEYIGCDFSSGLVAVGKEDCFVECSADNLPFPAGTFDCTLAVGLFQHLEYSQKVADELLRVTREGGYIIINTLRQFSLAELLLILAVSIFRPTQFRLAWAIMRRDYFSGLVIGGNLVARRYTFQELQSHFHLPRDCFAVVYNGIGESSFLARELTVVVKKDKKQV